MRGAQARWAGAGRPQYAAVAGQWAALDLSAVPAARLIEGAREIVKAAADHYLTIQSGILPVAYTSEAVFTATYNRLVKRKDDPPALTFLLGFDSTPIQAEKSLYDLATWARAQPNLADYLKNTAGAEIAAACQADRAHRGRRSLARVHAKIWRAPESLWPCGLRSGFRQEPPGRRSGTDNRSAQILSNGTRAQSA
jgi:pyruvate,water dikinase